MVDLERSSDALTVGAAALAPVVAGAALVAVRTLVDNTNIALILVVLVVAAGAIGGRTAGACAAVTAALSFNFFHTKPYLSLHIDAAEDVETAVLLLIIGLIVGQIAAVARRRGDEAQTRREEEERVWRVVEQAVSGAEPQDLILAVRAELTMLLALHECWWDPNEGPSTLPVLQTGGVLKPSPVHRFSHGEFELPSGGFDIPVRADGRVLGYFRCVPIAGLGVALHRRRTAVVLADAVGLALRRQRSFGRSDQ